MRERLLKWAIALTITVAVPSGLIFVCMPYLDMSHATYLTAKGDYQTALHALNRAAAMDPGNAQIYIRRSFLFDKLGEYHQALADADKAMALNAFGWESYNNRAWTLAQMPGGDLAGALRDANRAVVLCPSCAAAFDSRGWVELKQDQWQNALADFNRALELDPQTRDFAAHREVALEKLEERQKLVPGTQQPAKVSAAAGNIQSTVK